MNNPDRFNQVICTVYKTTIASNYHALLLQRRGKSVHEILFLDANLIRVALECDNTSRHACLYHGTLGHSTYSQNDKGRRKEKGKAEVWNFLSDLSPVLNHTVLMVCLSLFSA
jgi:hypothetical protein